MADLKGEQLKDSYQNLVTRGTGNKLENGNGVEFADLDDKASLSGGSDANFEAMPWVGGSPIIEMGENANGFYVIYQNGFVEIFQSRQDMIFFGNNDILTFEWTYPVSFSSGPVTGQATPDGTTNNIPSGSEKGLVRLRSVSLNGFDASIVDSSGPFSSGDSLGIRCWARGITQNLS